MANSVSAEDLYLFDTRGHLLVKGLVTKDEVVKLKQEVRHLAIPSDSETATYRADNIYENSSSVRSLAADARIVARLRSFINQPFRVFESYAVVRERGSRLLMHGGYSELNTLPWDEPAMRDLAVLHTFHNDRLYCMYVKVLLYLEDIRARADAPFCYVEGSHKANFPLLRPRYKDGRESLPLVETDFPGLVLVYPSAGDVLFLNEALMHGTLPKTSEGDRIFMAFSYGPSFMADWKLLDGENRNDLRALGYHEGDVEEDLIR